MAVYVIPGTHWPSDWYQWATGVLNGIGAPVNDTNLQSLWNWSVHESGQNVMRWDNPLNTTQPGYGGVDKNSVGVKSYPNVSNGIAATVQTLKNGFYPNIVANLRASKPTSAWQNAINDLKTWGSGASWLGLNFPAAAVLGPSGSAGQQGVSLNPLDGVAAAIKGFGDLLGSVLAHVAFTFLGILLVLLGVVVLLVPELRRVAPAVTPK